MVPTKKKQFSFDTLFFKIIRRVQFVRPMVCQTQIDGKYSYCWLLLVVLLVTTAASENLGQTTYGSNKPNHELLFVTIWVKRRVGRTTRIQRVIVRHSMGMSSSSHFKSTTFQRKVLICFIACILRLLKERESKNIKDLLFHEFKIVFVYNKGYLI